MDARLQTLLAETLPWAQACAMIQPVSPGMADKLRARCYRHLPAEHLQRLAALPGTVHSVAGLRFSTEVLAELRRGFVRGQDESVQVDVLETILLMFWRPYS